MPLALQAERHKRLRAVVQAHGQCWSAVCRHACQKSKLKILYNVCKHALCNIFNFDFGGCVLPWNFPLYREHTSVSKSSAYGRAIGLLQQVEALRLRRVARTLWPWRPVHVLGVANSVDRCLSLHNYHARNLIN